jgi:phage terminase small subunit
MKLTAQQEKFAQAIADGMSQADAYRAAYRAGKMKDQAIYVNASKLAADAKVALRVAELKKALSEKALWTREQAVQALIDESRGDRASDRISALKALNDMHGYNAPAKLDIRGAISVAVSFD